MLIRFNNVIMQIKCYFNLRQHFRLIDTPVNIDDHTTIRTIPNDTSARMIDVVAGTEMIVPQLFVTIGIVEFICLFASSGKRASMTD